MAILVMGCDGSSSPKQGKAPSPAAGAHVGSKEPSSQISTTSKASNRYVLADFPIRAGLTPQQLETAVGRPSRIIGFGLTYYVYDLTTGEELILLFDFGGKRGLSYAFVQAPGNTDTLKRRVLLVVK